MTTLPNDRAQPKEVSKGYFNDAEEMKDFIDFLFDVEMVGDYSELWNKFKAHEENKGVEMYLDKTYD